MGRMKLNRVFKGLAAAGLALSLSACNLVITETPTFAASDAEGAPILREGLWANLKPGCEADLSQAKEQWPECATAVTIADSAMTGETKEGGSQTLSYVLAKGDPRVMQMHLEAPEQDLKFYMYVAIRPVKSDEQGRITSYTGWIVQCGPPPPKNSTRENGQPRFGTLKPSPGMVMDEKEGCTPEDKAALTRAAKDSETYEGQGPAGLSQWVRD
jgi:hypothetical protein